MSNVLSISSGIAGLISLSSSAVVAGYKYVDSIRSAPEDLKSLLRETASLNSVLSQLMSHCMSDEPARQIAYYELNENNDIVKELLHNARDVENEKILEWLSMLNETVKHMTTTALKQPGTYEWFLKEQRVLDWLSTGTLLWLHGASGVGKTVLVSSLIEHIADSPRYKAGIDALSYHYCDFSDPSTLEPAKILGSLVWQTTARTNNISPAIRTLYRKYAQQSPQSGMLVQILSDVVAPVYGTTYLIIDGLDESRERQQLLDAIQPLHQVSEKSRSIKILLSSRPELDIRQRLLSNLSFLIETTHTELAIKTHIRSEIARIPKLSAMPVSAQGNILSSLTKRADGMFRWVQCQLDALGKVRTPRALEHALRTLPAGLYNRLDPAERLMVPEDVLNLCGSLVRLQGDQAVVLSHFSVKEYLLSGHPADKEPRLAKFALKADESWHYVTQCLLSYILSIGMGVREQQLNGVVDEDEYPLTSFAKCTKWTRYQDSIAIAPWMNQHLHVERSTDWLSLLDYVRPNARQAISYDVAYVRGILLRSLICFWNRHIQDDGLVKDSSMSIAVGKIARLLLRLQQECERPENSEVILSSSEMHFTSVSPLCAAASFDCDSVLRFLLNNGALVDGTPSPGFVSNPLLRALEFGNQRIVRTLIEFGANINVRGLTASHGCTALTSAAIHSSELVRYLLDESNVNTNMVDAFGRTFAMHDTEIGRNSKPLLPRLNELRERETEFLDKSTLYATILGLLKEVKRYPISAKSRNSVYNIVSQFLFHIGPKYFQYGAAFAEQSSECKVNIRHSYHCSMFSLVIGPDISDGEMDYCRGHMFYELPRPCWYNFEESVVLEDGSNLPEMIDFLERDITALLEGEQERVSQTD
ncbi:hypothetical protein EJ04DRAFT_566899 [Polyplosphaeria fusca]|uniref:NACHT domain-containing protein n=1 Tax=Polyplosphaeria fusca TaxID=682080 RepID=A0A9P4UZV5_9PLEO|nr:hypothetical protein EJ04DRAFT_566899 [Polyplosphaeria fusca]